MTTIIEIQDDIQNLTKAKITQIDIAQALGCGRSNISLRAKNNSKLSFEEIKKIERFFNVSLADKQILNDSEHKIECDYFPDVFGSCGNGAFVLSETKEKIQIPEKCFIKPISKVKKYSVINAVGSSMQPLIFDKDKLIVEHCELGDKIQDDKVYVFCYDEQIMVKRLYYNVDEIIVKSDNPDPIFKVKYITKENMDKFILIGQIVGLMRDCR